MSSDRSRWASRFAILALVLAGGWLGVSQIAQARLPEAADNRPFTAQLGQRVENGSACVRGFHRRLVRELQV